MIIQKKLLNCLKELFRIDATLDINQKEKRKKIKLDKIS